MYPILTRYGPFFLYTFTVVLGIGILFSLLLITQQAKRQQLSHSIDATLVVLAAALIGGRLAFVWANTLYFAERQFLAWQPWQGGLSYHGALLAGFIGLWGWCKWGKRPFYPYASLFAFALPLLVAFGWLACWFEGCGYGREAILMPPWQWFTGDLPDNFGVYALRYHTQWLGLLWSLLVFLFTWRRPYNQRLPIALATLSFGLAALTLLRGDPIPTIGQWRLDTLLDLTIGLIALSLLQYKQKLV